MEKLITKLAQVYGPSGREERIKDQIAQEVEGFVDEVRTDSLGNLITSKGVIKDGGVSIMLAAHMDGIGIIVTHIDDKGFLRFAPVGGISPFRLIGQRIIFQNGTVGTFGHEKLEKMAALTLQKMFIDIGASNKKDACSYVKVGDMAGFHREVEKLGDRLIGATFDDRVGCAILIELLKKVEPGPNQIYGVFTAQEEVGLRGAITSAYGISPDLAIAIDVTPIGDTPEAGKMAVSLGEGAAIKVKDASVITHVAIKDALIETAEEAGIPYQLEVLEQGGTDAGGIHLAREGVRTGGVSIPARYIHSHSEMIDIRDVKACLDLLCEFTTKRLDGLKKR